MSPRIVPRSPAAAALLLAASLLFPAVGSCQLAGTQPDNLSMSEQLNVIRSLETIFPESMGFRVHAPLEPRGGTREDYSRLVKAYRVIVPPEITMTEAARRFTAGSSPFTRCIDTEQDVGFLPVTPVGYSGAPVTAKLDKKIVDVHFLTVNMDRWLIWARDCYFLLLKSDRDTPIQEYAAEVSQYLRRTDFGDEKPPELKASSFGVQQEADLFGGYENQRHSAPEFEELSSACKEIDLDVAEGMSSFTAAEGAVSWLVDHSGKTTFSDRDQADLQRAFYDFVDEGRDTRELRALTPEILESLEPGRYFFAVDAYGRVRFGQMRWTPDQGRDVIWAERLKSYECLLFPGQPVKAAGEFEVAWGERVLEANLTGATAPTPRIVSVNAFSSYYYYRPDEKDLEGRLKGKSDSYLRSVGHFFKALRGMGYDPEEVRVSKF